MSFLRKLCIVGTGVCVVCVTRSAQFVKSASGISDDESAPDDDRFQIDHIKKRGLRLKMVQVFFRHGARTPLNIIPNPKNIPELEQVWDKDALFSGGEGLLADYVVKDLDGGAMPENRLDAIYKQVLFKGGTYAGQLTTKGKQQMHHLGELYKNYYIDELQFIDPKFTPEHIHIRSTNVKRTIESAACVLAGMFGKDMKQQGGPVSIFVASPVDEILYPNGYSCKRFSAFNKDLWDDNDIMPGMRHNRRHIQDILGIPQNERLDFVKLRDVLACQKVHGIPSMGILNSLSDFIDKCAVDLLNFYVCRPGKHRLELLQMAGGRVVQMVNDNMQQAVHKDNFKKFHMYSCHDTMLISVLNGLDIFDNRWPPYAADLVFELYEDKEGAHFVRTMYLGKEKCIYESKEAIIPLEQFLELTSKVAISKDNYLALCNDVATL